MNARSGEAKPVPTEVLIAVQPAGVSAVSAAPSFSATNSDAPLPSDIPLVMSKDEAFYWSALWQAGEAESRASFAAGRGRRFGSAREAIRYLLSTD